MQYQKHPQSELFPAMSSEELRSLVESMKANGFDSSFPIMLYENQIVDGWHRYQAALKAKVTPQFRVWCGERSKLQAFVIYANSTRRHLSKAAHAAALIKARVHGVTMTDKQIERIAGVARATVNEQKRLRDKNPEIADEVAAGHQEGDMGTAEGA